MRIAIAQPRLLEALRSVAALELPTVVIATSGLGVTISAGDPFSRFSTTVPCDVQEPGRVTVKADILRAITQEIKTTISLNDPKPGRTRVAAGSFEAELLDGPPVLHVLPYSGPCLTFDPRRLKAAIQAVSPIVQDNANFGGMGSVAQLSWENREYRFISTDGHRLTKTWGNLESSTDGTGSVLLSHKAVRLLSRLVFVGQVSVTAEERVVTVTDGTTTAQFQPAVMQYPPVERVIPQSHRWSCVVDQVELERVLAMMTDVMTAKVNKGELFLSCAGLNASQAVLESDGDMPDWKVNAQYLKKSLTTDAKVRLMGNGPMNPVMLEPNDHTIALVMPIR